MNAQYAPASAYSFADLAEIYNQSRVDYIVPMPMNPRRMEEYVLHYDVDLDSSAVSLNDDGEVTGVGMLGRRGERAWITRLGVLPDRRGSKVGAFLMHTLIHNAQHGSARCIQLEVIRGNIPAYNLFHKLGFQELRELLVVRRPPGPPTDNIPPYQAAPIRVGDVSARLGELHTAISTVPGEGAAWTEEVASLVNLIGLEGVDVTLDNGTQGWLLFQRTSFQMLHFAFCPQAHDNIELAEALLHAVHRAYPMQDTKIENIPAASRLWTAYQRQGYIETFRRIEMLLHLPYP